MKRNISWVLLAVLIGLTACSPKTPALTNTPPEPPSTTTATNQTTMPSVQPPSFPPAPPIGADEAMMAASYAQAHNVSVEEAVRRERLQRVIGELSGKLTNYEKETFAGLWIEHTPVFRVVALFTSLGNETIQPYLTDELRGIVEVRGAETSLAELVAIQDNTTKSIENLGIPTASEVDVYQNRVKFYVVDRARLDTAIKDGKIVLSPKVDVITVTSFFPRNTDVYGGL